VEYLCTSCSKEKRDAPGLMPAIDRYRSDRIHAVFRHSQETGVPMLILSGKYGLVAPETPIPYYDQPLLEEAIDRLLPRVVERLQRSGATVLRFYGDGPQAPGWAPYYALLARACGACNVRFVTEATPTGEGAPPAGR
jgi:hypothetical protein